jgi:sugar lactone lactonase YvrE
MSICSSGEKIRLRGVAMMKHMQLTRRQLLAIGTGGALALLADPLAAAQDAQPWPPPLPGAKNGTVTLRSERFLDIPDSVAKASKEKDAAPFTVAKTPPTVELALHGDLGTNAVSRRLWSSWGDICVAGDGRVYSGIGDHGDDVGGDARCFIYRWDPKTRTLGQVVDMNRVIAPQKGQPAWSKVHAKIDEGPDGKIYFSCTLNDGNRAVQPAYRWTDRLPGGQLYQFDPKTGKTAVFADLPRPRCTATSLLDRARNIWWCNLEGGGNALWGLSLASRKPVFQGPDGSVVFNRNFAMARDGAIYFNGDKGAIMKYDPVAGKIVPTRSAFAGSPGMRSSTSESRDGAIYGTTHSTGQLFRYRPAKDDLTLLGPAWMRGDYVTVAILSPDERFVYYLPGAHGNAFRHGTPVIQYEVASGRRKVLAFLAPAFEREHGYVPAGTYGAKLSSDGSTLFVNFNGHAADKHRPKTMKPNGFGLCGFAAIHVPKSER